MRTSITYLIAPLWLVGLVACAAAKTQAVPPSGASGTERVVISGSTTLQPVVEEWVREFRRTHPGLEIVVEGGGTDKGIEQVIAGTSQIAMAARQILDSERRAAAEKGVVIEEFVVARAGISVLKNKRNPVEELDVPALRRIFDGSVNRWSEVGGPDQPITVILRNPSSHTADHFWRLVVAPSAFNPRGLVVGTQEKVVAGVTANPWAIGFADFDRALNHLDEVEVLKVRTGEAMPKLVFIRSLYFYARAPMSDAVKDLVAFPRSPRGGEIAVKHTYFGPDDPS